MARWENIRGVVVHYAEVNEREVVVGSHSGSGHTDFAGACSHEAFLADRRLHDAVLSEHGPETLAQMIEAVRKAVAS